MRARPNVHMELGRVIFSNPEKYTVDIISESGRTLRGVPYLSPYGKPNSEGQGMYMLPEQDSYVMILNLLPTGSDNYFGREVFCFGFFNPTDEKGGFSAGREELSPGDFCLKTVAGNKIIGSTDGVNLIYSTDLCQIQLFPFSGNVQDSAGLDNLIRMFMENFELHTDGGFWTWKVNKKENKTNFSYQFKNKPLNENNPDIVRGNIGGQGLMGDDTYFHTVEYLNTKAQGETEVLRVSQKEKIDGTLERSTFSEDGQLEHHLLLNGDGSKVETQYNGGSPVWVSTREKDGTTKLSIGAGGEFNLEITPDGKVTIYTASDVEITVDGKVQKSVDKDYIESIVGSMMTTIAQSLVQEVTQSVMTKSPQIHLNSGNVLLGESGHKGVVNESGKNVFDRHVHEVSFSLSAPNGPVTGTITLAPPATKMPVSTVVKASD